MALFTSHTKSAGQGGPNVDTVASKQQNTSLSFMVRYLLFFPENGEEPFWRPTGCGRKRKAILGKPKKKTNKGERA